MLGIQVVLLLFNIFFQFGNMNNIFILCYIFKYLNNKNKFKKLCNSKMLTIWNKIYFNFL